MTDSTESLATRPGWTFLSAQWRNLVLLNYAVPDEVLLPHLPPGCALDRHEGSAWVSLVAFQFLETRVLGVKWPGFVNFPEVNLRFYVTHEGRRGVAFIREYVPSRLVAWIARTLYNEPYRAAPMQGRVADNQDGGLDVAYGIDDQRAGGRFDLKLTASAEARLPQAGSLEHFFKEHELGLGTDRSGQLVTYRVWHPHWTVRAVSDLEMTLDWGAMYGAPFAFLQPSKPGSVVFADGSEIRVFSKGSS